jgi:hypothetical protein
LKQPRFSARIEVYVCEDSIMWKINSSVSKDYYLKGLIAVRIAGRFVTGKTKQYFTPLSFNWMGKELQLGSLFVLALQTGKAVVQISAP